MMPLAECMGRAIELIEAMTARAVDDMARAWRDRMAAWKLT